MTFTRKSDRRYHYSTSFSMKKTSFLIYYLLLAVHSLPAQELLVKPYLQPGNASTLAKEEKVLIWQTDSVPATYTVQASLQNFTSSGKVIKAKASNVELKLKGKTTLLYRAGLKGLLFDTVYYYKVIMNEKTIAHDTFRTRTKKPLNMFCRLRGLWRRHASASGRRFPHRSAETPISCNNG